MATLAPSLGYTSLAPKSKAFAINGRHPGRVCYVAHRRRFTPRASIEPEVREVEGAVPAWHCNWDHDGLECCQWDPYLNNYREHLRYRFGQYKNMRSMIDKDFGGLENFTRGYNYLGFSRTSEGIFYREWAPAAHAASLIGDFNDWNPERDVMTKSEFGIFEIFLPNNADGSPAIPHGSRVKIHICGESGEWIDKIPAWIKMAVQAPNEIPYNGVYYDPPEEQQYVMKHPRPPKPRAYRIYEAHVGICSPEPKVASYIDFRDNILPRIKALGYNTVQLMAIQEHAFYGSFGYHVTNFFAPSSRFGTPDELKSLVDRAHELGLHVIMDIVHSHASSNALDGINLFDGSESHYFHSGPKGHHWVWDSRCFDYAKPEVLRFLLSNVRWWIEEFGFDGYRFDGVTSMMYHHHGLNYCFTGNYDEYMGFQTDVDALVYMMLANDVARMVNKDTVTIAEDVSGMPTLGRPVREGGLGFDYRLAMSIPDKWVELLGGKQLPGNVYTGGTPDELWDLSNIVFTLENRRAHEKTIAYAESHDQSIVGSKTIAFWLMDQEMYWNMTTLKDETPVIARGMALHKMIRLITFSLGGEGYLNFAGNEFGHPEWLDFPREDRYEASTGRFIPGNGNSYDKCRRRYDLADAEHLRYAFLQNFDVGMQALDEFFHIMSSSGQYVSRKDNGDKMVVFERGPLVFVFNFHTHKSYTDYRIGCMKTGNYRLVLSTDEPEYGGYNNASVTHGVVFPATDYHHDGRPASFLVYSPCRTATVYAIEEDIVSAGILVDAESGEQGQGSEKVSAAVINGSAELKEKASANVMEPPPQTAVPPSPEPKATAVDKSAEFVEESVEAYVESESTAEIVKEQMATTEEEEKMDSNNSFVETAAPESKAPPSDSISSKMGPSGEIIYTFDDEDQPKNLRGKASVRVDHVSGLLLGDSTHGSAILRV